jgi:catechol 2,3-dioxygenase-like lactoylglutathione lyase family enzyme
LEPRVTLITLGVSDLPRARKFYEALGFVASGASQESVTFFPAGGIVLALWSRSALAEDAHATDDKPGSGFAGIALAHNARSEAEVDAVLAEAVAAGARLMKPAQKVFWGGYSGYFADPDGHLWEVAYNPGWPLDAEGRVQLPPPPPAR